MICVLMTVVYLIESNESHKQANISLSQLVATNIALLAKYLLTFVQSLI